MKANEKDRERIEALLLEYDQGGYPDPFIPRFVALLQEAREEVLTIAERIADPHLVEGLNLVDLGALKAKATLKEQ